MDVLDQLPAEIPVAIIATLVAYFKINATKVYECTNVANLVVILS